MRPSPFGRGLAFPPRVGADGHMQWSEGERNVRECMQALLLTEPNERLFLPDYGAGLGTFLHAPNTVTTRSRIADTIKTALARWEPRVLVDAVTVEPDPDDSQGAIATITYRLVATRGSDTLAVRVRVGT